MGRMPHASRTAVRPCTIPKPPSGRQMSRAVGIPSVFVALLVLATFPGQAKAQTPKITSAGDPSVRADTLYMLAAEAQRRYGTDARIPYAYLLDDGVVRLDAEGRGSRTYRQVVYILQKLSLIHISEPT